MPFGSLQATIIAIVTTIVSLVVGFGIIDESTAGQITAAAGSLVSAIFLLANAIIHHGESQTGVPATKTLGKS